MSNTVPDEKVVVCFLAHLSKRLLEIGRETAASISIQRCWRNYYNRVVLKKKTEAAVTLQRYMRGYLARRFLGATKYVFSLSLSLSFCANIFISFKGLQLYCRLQSGNTKIGNNIRSYAPLRCVFRLGTSPPQSSCLVFNWFILFCQITDCTPSPRCSQ